MRFANRPPFRIPTSTDDHGRLRALGPRLVSLAALALLAWGGISPTSAQTSCDGTEEPYVFFVFDSSGSLNWTPPCTSAQMAAGDCGYLCPTGNCFTPLSGDDPASKLYQMKEALYTAVESHPDNLYGFATLNQDDLRVRDKHWLYTVAATDPYGAPNAAVLLYSGRPYPETGLDEVFGQTWACDEGSGIREAGCWPNSYRIADLDDPWEARRARRLPKLGRAMDQTTTVYLRDVDGLRYRMRYRPVPTLPDGSPNAYGNPKLAVEIDVSLCINDSTYCSASLVGQEIVYFDLVSDFSSWDNGADTAPPYDGFFYQSNAADAVATYPCEGWDSNDDTPQDLYYGYTLRFPTLADPPPLRFDTDGDGVAELEDFSFGDVIPLDWEDDHRNDILERLAPNTVLDPLAVPDFRVATYLSDDRLPGQSYLRLADEGARPIVADGVSGWAEVLRDFRDFLDGAYGSTATPFWSTAALLDPDFACRQKKLVILADGAESCSSDASLACDVARVLFASYGLRIHVIGYGTSGSGDTLDCMANTGGTGQAARPHTPRELLDAIRAVLN
ncbi:MAG: hypothetical protein MI919_07905 [Holophagales bacterium]|nr:hypothetical protein [Holophagales bacterium]